MQKSSHKKDLRKKFLNWFKGLWPILVILLAVLVFFYPVWLEGLVPLPADFVVGVYFPWLDYKWGYSVGVPVKNPMTTDVVSFIYPMQMLGIDLLKSGQWPLWNPYILMGTPLLANFQSAPFSPTNIVYFLFERLNAWSIQIILQHFLAALFTYFLLRSWRISKLASVFGGIVFAFSGFNVIWSQWNGHALAAAFIPLILFFEDKWLQQKGGILVGIGISVSLALQILSGYPQVVFYSFVAMFVLWIFRLRKEKLYLFKTAALGVFLVLGLGLVAFQILPSAELLSLSQREIEPHPFEWAFLPFAKIITFLAPDFFGNHATKNYWGPQDYTSNTGFVGVVAIFLSVLAIRLVKVNSNVRFSLGLLLLSFLLAFPTPLSIILWKSGVFGFQAASAHRALVLFNLAIALLSGFGVDYFLMKKKVNFLPSFLVPAIILGSFGLYSLILFFLSRQNPIVYPPDIRDIPRYIIGMRNLVFPSIVLLSTVVIFWVSSRYDRKLKRISVFLLLFLMSFELFRFGWKFTPFSPRHIVFPKTPILDFLTAQEKPFRVTGSHVIPINMRMPYKLETPEGYDAVYPLKISEFLVAINRGSGGAGENRRYAIIDNETSPLLGLLNTRYYLGIKKDADGIPSAAGKVPKNFDPARFKIAFEDKSVAVLESNSSLPRAFMVYDWEVVKSENQMDQLLDKNFPMSSKILLEEDAAISPGKEKGKFSAEYKKSLTSYKKYEESESLLNVITENPGLLFVSETFYPGWKAYIDDKETKIYKADYAFRAVSIPKGDHEVRFVYSPDSFFNGVKISILSALALALFMLVNILLGKRIKKSYT